MAESVASLVERPEWWSADEWSTPTEVLDKLVAEFGPFTLDVCARTTNAKADRFYTLNENGLEQSWSGQVWLNPPYSDIGPWLAKARQEISLGHCRLVCALIPAATDTGWFHDHVIGQAEIRFLRGRVRFIGWQGTPIPAPRTPSIIAIYRLREAASRLAEGTTGIFKEYRDVARLAAERQAGR